MLLVCGCDVVEQFQRSPVLLDTFCDPSQTCIHDHALMIMYLKPYVSEGSLKSNGWNVE